jgi:hypothetical protein
MQVWDRYILQPALRRAAAGKKSGCFSCFGWCFEQGASDSATATLRASEPQPEPAVHEYGRIAWPFSKPPPMHRLAVPPEYRERVREPPVPPEPPAPPGWRGALAHVRPWLSPSHLFGPLFDVVWRLRYPLIAAVIAISVAGCIGTFRLKPPSTSEPPIFQKDHNVQFFYRYLNSRQADNIPDCPTCKGGIANTFRNAADVTNNPQRYFSGAVPQLTTSAVRASPLGSATSARCFRLAEAGAC